MRARITLVGYRACGKTTVGRLLARRLGWAALDLDAAIEAASGESIAAVFARAGEAEFRRREAATLEQVLASTDPQVLATGGGCVLDPGNRAILHTHGGLVVYLAVPIAILEQRLRSATGARPSLTGAHPAAEVAIVLGQREAFYREVANRVVDGARPPGEVVEHIVAAWGGCGEMVEVPSKTPPGAAPP